MTQRLRDPRWLSRGWSAAASSRGTAEALAFVACAVIAVGSAVVAKRSNLGPALVALADAPRSALASPSPATPSPALDIINPSQQLIPAELGDVSTPWLASRRAERGLGRSFMAAARTGEVGMEPAPGQIAPQGSAPVPAPEAPIVGVEADPFAPYPDVSPPEGFVRYFDGRPLRAVRTIMMTVTAYSPDAASCYPSDDGYTATNHSVWTNAMELVAADTRILPFGSMITVPGYAEDHVVPVLDRGGAIKGNRLDLLFPTHASARQWGVKRVPITVWEFADGKGTGRVKVRYPRRSDE